MSVGIYPTSPASEVEYLLDHSESVVLFAEDEEQVDKVLAVREKLAALRTVVVIDPRGVDRSDDRVITLAELEERGPRRAQPTSPARVAGIDPLEPAIIVYTSGTTGPPKGAMLSHANLLAAARATRGVAFDVDERAEVLSYLPLCHIAERLVSVHRRHCKRLRRELRRGGRDLPPGPARGAADVLPRRARGCGRS